MNKTKLFFALFFSGLSFAYGQNMKERPNKVSFEEQLEILEVLKSDDKAAQGKIFQQVSNNPDAYIPPVLHRYAGELFEEEKSKKGWFWHFVAELRGRVDANLTTYEKAMQFVSFISSINAAKIKPDDRFENLNQLKETVEKVVNYVRKNSVSYARSWIVLLKFKAEPVDGQKVDMKIDLMKPQGKWETIKQETIDEYEQNFQKYAQKDKHNEK